MRTCPVTPSPAPSPLAPVALAACFGAALVLTTSVVSAQQPPWVSPIPTTLPQPWATPPPVPQPPQGVPQPVPPQAAPPPTIPTRRTGGEMVFLYGAAMGYGALGGIWMDSVAKITNPGPAVVAPVILGVAAPIGVYLWDSYDRFRPGVPSSIATGLALGAGEGLLISAVQWQFTREQGKDWSFASQTSATLATTTGGGVGGFFFGEWFRPDPRGLALVASGSGWGALAGTLFGAGVSGKDWKDAGSVGALVGYNLGMVATGVLATQWTPSWQTQKYMWLGYLGGTAASSVVYLFYIGSDQDPKGGLIANSLGGLAGVALAAIFTAGLSDQPGQAKEFKPPVEVGFSPTPYGGGVMTAHGSF